VRPLVQVDGALATLAVVVPGLLAGKQLGEAMRPIAVRGHAAIELAAMTRLAEMAIEAHPRPNMARSQTHRPCLTPRLPRRRHRQRRSYGRRRTECSARSDGRGLA